MKPVLIGQAPGGSKSSWPAESEPLMGRAGRKLASLAGVEYPKEYRHTFTRMNIFNVQQPKKGKGDAFDAQSAVRMATRLRIRFEGRIIIMLGHAVARAFKCSTLEYLMPTPMQEDGAVLVKFPHPSGVNKWWNDQEQTDNAAFFLSEIVRGRVHYSSHFTKYEI